MKAKLSYFETREYIDLILELPTEQARYEVYRDLSFADLTEGQFHDAIEQHAGAMNLSSEQWLKIFQTYTSTVFRSRFDLPRLLSENYLKQLMGQ